MNSLFIVLIGQGDGLSSLDTANRRWWLYRHPEDGGSPQRVYDSIRDTSVNGFPPRVHLPRYPFPFLFPAREILNTSKKFSRFGWTL